jgi:hypothetical protein
MALAQGKTQGKGLTTRIGDLEKERVKLPEERAARQDARRFQWLEVDGNKLEPRVQRLIQDLHWHKTLAAAKKAAVQSGKPILWIHALGDIDGFL